MKTDALYKSAYNRTLKVLSGLPRGSLLPSASELSASLGVSRTTAAKIYLELEGTGIATREGRGRTLARRPLKRDAFEQTETVSRARQIESQFLQWVLHADRRAGEAVNALELAREFGVSTTSVREFLLRFSRFGLIEPRANSHWVLKGFNREFALELFDIREMFELRAARAFANLPPDAPQWQALSAMRDEHQELLTSIEERFSDFSVLDDRFHRLIHEAARNRFIDDFYDVIAIIFHYHYQWNKVDERQRNQVAIREHLAYIDALLARDVQAVIAACSAHLASARRTLLNSLA